MTAERDAERARELVESVPPLGHGRAEAIDRLVALLAEVRRESAEAGHPCPPSPATVARGGIEMSLAEALPAEMTRVRDELLPMYMSIGPPGTFAVAVMRQALDRAQRALASGDVVEMLRAHEELKGFKE